MRKRLSPRRQIGDALRTNLSTTEERIGGAIGELRGRIDATADQLDRVQAALGDLAASQHRLGAAVAEVGDQIKRLAAQTQEQQFGHGTFLGDELVLAAHPTGLQMLVDATDRTITPYIIGGKYERELSRLWTQLVAPGDVVLEIGANQGFHTLALALRAGPGGRVVAYEPNPRTARVLDLNVVMSGMNGRIAVERYAVSDTDGRAHFRALAESPGGSQLADATSGAGDQPGQLIEVQTRSVPTVLAGLPAAPNIVKIDAEGHEIPIMRELLHGLPADQLPVFVVECIPSMMDAHGGLEAFVALVAEHGLEVFAFQDRPGPVAVDLEYLRAVEWEDVVLAPKGLDLHRA